MVMDFTLLEKGKVKEIHMRETLEKIGSMEKDIIDTLMGMDFEGSSKKENL